MDDIQALAAMIYGEGASTDYDTMKMIGSTAINRLKSGKSKEFGASIPEIIQKGYYAASNANIPYQQASINSFPDKKSENAYKQALAIASGLIKGSIKPDKGHFYFTDKEIAKMKRQGNKAFNFNAVKPMGAIGGYKVFGY